MAFGHGAFSENAFSDQGGRALRLSVDAATFTFTGTAATLVTGKGLVASGGSFAVTGTDASLERGFEIAADAGSFEFTGSAATLTYISDPVLAADSAAFAVSGTAASLERGFEIAADAGSFEVTGTAATFARSYVVAAGAGSYAFTGSDVSFLRTYIAAVDAGSFTVTGTAASLERGYVLAAAAGSFAVTGTDASFPRTYLLSAGAGSFAISGTAASLEFGRLLAAAAGSFTFTGASTTELLRRLFLRPDADDTDGTWTDQNDGTDLYAAIDEVTADDADYIKSTTSPVNDLCKISLANPGPDGIPDEPVKVRYRYWKEGIRQIDLRVRLLEGNTEIASWTHTNISSTHTTAEQTLSAGEFAAIFDFDNLYIEMRANAP